MKLEEHRASFREHRDTVFRWGLDIKGIENSQRIVGLHASRAIINLLSIRLLKEGRMSPGKQINHRWFKSKKVIEKLPEFPGIQKIVPKMVELELLCENLSYGAAKPATEAKKAIELFNELVEMIGDEEE